MTGRRGALPLAFVAIVGCAGSYAKKIQKSEEAFYRGDIDTAVSTITPLAQDASARDRLLYYMEAGIVYHCKGDYQTSNAIFSRADEMAEEIKTSITGEAKSFLLSDREAEFQGENFERILIKYYIALNHVLLGQLESAKRSLRRLEADLKEMKYEDAAYKQILIARYLDALISEELGQYNDARVQYKNLELFGVDRDWLLGERYLLAQHAKDAQDMRRYAAGRRAPLMQQAKAEPTGELVLLVETGKAAVKASRGNLLNDQEFALALRVAIDVAILTDGKGLSTAGVIAMLGTAENPIPQFVPREQSEPPGLSVNGVAVPKALPLTDFDFVAQKNFNDNYSSYINKNVASLATKIVVAAVAADALAREIRKNSDSMVGALGGLAVGLGAGGAVAATVKPDLRSWRMLPSRFYAQRLVLPAGKYQLEVQPGSVVYGNAGEEVVITAGRKTFIALRAFSPGL